MIKIVLILLPLLFLHACASVGAQSEVVSVSTLSPGIQQGKNNYHAVLTMDGGRHDIIVHVDAKSNYVAMVGFGPLGNSIFECVSQDGGDVCHSAVQAIPARSLFHDMSLMLVARDRLPQYLDMNGLAYKDSGDKRSVYDQAQVIIEIAYSENDVSLKNTRYGYAVRLEPVGV